MTRWRSTKADSRRYTNNGTEAGGAMGSYSNEQLSIKIWWRFLVMSALLNVGPKVALAGAP
jgi:hypothetical protein